MTDAAPPILIVGVSTRAAAESAARAGFAVATIDAFADLDQHPAVRARTTPGRFGPRAAVKAASAIACSAVSYLSMFENHPDAVASLAAGRTLWGNAAATLCRVRNPQCIFDSLTARHLPAAALGGAASGSWLSKPLASGGGQDIHTWRPTARTARGRYVQERIEGVPASVVFVAAQRQARILGVSRQLVGLHRFGADAFRYCGSILDRSLLLEHREQFERIAQGLTEDFALVGVNGVDVIVRGRDVVAIEVNPRWCSSMELVERAYGISVFGAHAAACQRNQVPCFDLPTLGRDLPVSGKAVVFAREDVTIQDTRAWLRDPSVRDVPREGDQIAAGRPVCTVFASGSTPTECHANLERRAAQLYQVLADWETIPS